MRYAKQTAVPCLDASSIFTTPSVSIAQFYRGFEFTKTSIASIDVESPCVLVSTQTRANRGLFASDNESSPGRGAHQKLDRSSPGSQANLLAEWASWEQPNAASTHFTEATLLAAMENIARFVTGEVQNPRNTSVGRLHSPQHHPRRC